MRYTNSAFRTREERDCIRGLNREQLIAKLISVGVPEEDAEEFSDDPNSVPTSVRTLIVRGSK